jgi:murein DD-endopeptidase MepM/ murein hydrolase activator NlpD
MRSPRYTILIANRKSGSVRRLTIARRVLAVAGATVVAVPVLAVLMGLGAQGADQREMDALRSANETLRLENESYREATGQLTDQISSLQSALTELSEQAEIDPATKKAIANLPQVVRSRAAGGGSALPVAMPAPVVKSPESTFGILRDLLGSIGTRLTSVKSQVESRQALARATPSSWPVAGYLSSQFGRRPDPFTGEPDYHTGLDVSAPLGTPIWATADGTVESAEYNGNYGRSIVVDHGFGIATRFGHLSSFNVRKGQHVKRGQVIGYVGSTGRATSSHLHYEILVNGTALNPLRFLR